MRGKIIDMLRRALGTKQIASRIEIIERHLRNSDSEIAPEIGSLKLLPGTEYATVALPLDYRPSREYAPRYGYSHGRIEPLEKWFTEFTADYDRFLDFLRTLKLGSIPVSLLPGSRLGPSWIGGAICAFDSLSLYGMLQKYRPATYLEIGSGTTTCFARQSVKDAGLKTKIVSIDPAPRQEVDAICDEVIRKGLENCDLDAFDRLEPGDILFFDGSHRTFMNSDVTVFFIDVLPRLKPGVVVHLHDITLPWDYPNSLKNCYWNEQYMLAVYLMCSMEKLTPLLPTAWVCRSPLFEKKFATPFVDLGSPDANGSWRGGGSMWFTKK